MKQREEPTLILPLEKATKEPYGDVEYADPGYKEDGKKRYPLTKDRVKAAWTYINMPKNQEGYTDAQVEKIKNKIKAAYKKFFDHEPGEEDKTDN